ncbi:hypothetical protein [Rhizobium sp. BK176]|uniref:hypothetical protein n=1 Tax=Rhizobium sp. BK176 TaxID=2587071 RepID=UPI0021670302|nr:hypothetical protein [Rhizobium sp. BK176]MCS4096222.1 hypothetical protein [Rhizobium sp. BK176]
MVEVLDELKAKLVEIDGKMEELRREIVVLEAQKSAFETVIRVYDPGFELAAPPSKASRASSRETASSRVTELLKGRNNRHIVLDTLRRAEPPTTTAEIADKFANESDLGSEASRLESALTSRFSATLNGLVKQGLVRQAGTAHGRRHLWEISR